MLTNMLKRRIYMMLSLLVIIMIIVSSIAACGKSIEEETASVPEETVQTEETTTEAPSETTTEETTTEETTTEETTEETTEAFVFEEPVSFYVFGVDTVGYTEVDKGRSDMLKLISIDTQERTIKSISVLRDTKAPIVGHDPQKINAAFMYGGAPLAMATLNLNFGLEIGDYIMINFSGLVILVDDIGGIDLEITEDEAYEINWHDGDYVGDGRQLNSIPVEAGMAHLDGSQTLAYCRTRKIDNDFFRSGRQNKAIAAIIEKIKAMPKTEYPKLIDQFFQSVTTNLSLEDITHLMALDLGDYEYEAYRVPDAIYETDLEGGQDETGSWVWTYDLTKAGERINSILEGTFVPQDITDDSYMKEY